MRFTPNAMPAVVAAIATGFGIISAPAQAFTVTQNDNFNDLLNVFIGNTEGLTNITGSLSGNSGSFGTFIEDPFDLGAGVVLSTGLVEQLPGENTGSQFFDADLTTSFSGVGSANLFDITTLEISFDADDTVEQIAFEYVFGSEEFLEFAGDIFNDFFTLELNGENLAFLDDSVGSDNLVNVNNLAFSPTGPFSSNYVDNPVGPGTLTKLDGFTEVLTFTGDVVTGSNTLKIQIADVSDAQLDSAVFIKANSLTVDPEPVPETSAIAGLLLLGLLCSGTKVAGRLKKA